MKPNEWGRFSDWQLVLPPNRPGSDVLKTIRSVLEGRPKPRRAAVLGSTSEYIDLLVRLGVHDLTCFDRSADFNKISQTFRQYPDAEQLVLGDWLQTLATYRRSFDLVLSDFTLGNVNYENQPNLMSLIADSLTPGGLLIDRVLTFRQKCHSYGSLVEYFAGEPSNLITLNAFNSMWLFCGQRVEENQRVDCAATYDWTLQNFDQPHIRWLAQHCQQISPVHGVWHYGKPWSEVARYYFKSLDRVAEYSEEPTSPFHGWAYVIVSRPKDVR